MLHILFVSKIIFKSKKLMNSSCMLKKERRKGIRGERERERKEWRKEGRMEGRKSSYLLVH